MATRFNGAIRALEAGTPAFATFAAAEPGTAQALAASAYEVVFEMEHGAYDIGACGPPCNGTRLPLADAGSGAEPGCT